MAVKLFAVLAGMVPLIVGVAFVGDRSLRSLDHDTNRLFRDNLRLAVAAAELSHHLGLVESTSLEELSADGARDEQLRARLTHDLIPKVNAEFNVFADLHRADPVAERLAIAKAFADWREFVSYSDSQTASEGLTTRARAARALRTGQLMDPIVRWTNQQAVFEREEAASTYASARRSFDRGRGLIFSITGLALVLGVLGALALIRNVLPRLREYSRFAGRVAAGDLTGRIAPRGRDELATLGRVLNDMVETRAREDRAKAAQGEFVETLQYSETEGDAHALIKRHLERSVSGATVVVLRNNNSADRLEPTTPLDEGSPLFDALEGAKPKSCLAVRFSKPHDEAAGASDALLQCAVCGKADRAVNCRPLLVGGEVMGAVLVESAAPLVDEERVVFAESVAEAAPVLANLRTLAIAELRAATDSLTGLSNDRGVRDTVKRMVAQASRGMSPLAAIALDLDHFKQINDNYGHGLGDEVLAAVGATLAATIRESDFAGRFGGEEFLVLLPDTPREGAVRLAEKLRTAVEAIEIPGVERQISASLGVAALPEHASTADSLLRAADRALYAAKRGGRNRVEVAEASEARSVPSAV